MVAPAVVPKALLFAAVTEPSITFVTPVKRLFPLNRKSPRPNLFRLFAFVPLTTPASSSVPPVWV
jgi:hypothetical protein